MLVTVSMADCTGLWRRTLLIGADGTHDENPGVLWLQGPTAYVDSRGFAGTLAQNGNIFEWHRAVDLQPPGPFPDAGEMRWEGDVLIETGVHEDYVEHWVRDAGEVVPTGALHLSGPGGTPALLVRVGALFGWADCEQVLIGTVGAADYRSLGIMNSGNKIQANGVHWTVDRTEGKVDS
ncbi:hypothetical protein [Mycobacterium aquaticum]|uniref:Uncharacterized protein n=1 Tax=Mycobacterium aquaticum TaxID=1927124 RepID=A0A1X0B5H0_9MYCO|nr:hypothetical protein [Mycobacterium aquaticum]ORA37584.1 hypothetical protein BST13_06965 [Mycobacterium aquaticum]